MNKKVIPFKALQTAAVLQGSLAEFARWMATYIAVLVPSASIQSWWHPDLLTKTPRKLGDLLTEKSCRWDAACFVTEAPNEGFHVNIAVRNEKAMTTLAIAKVDSDEATCGLVAMHAAMALEYILYWSEEPRFVSMLLGLPGASTASASYLRSSIAIDGPVVIQPHSVGDGSDLRLAMLDRTGQVVASFVVDDLLPVAGSFFAVREVLQDIQFIASYLGLSVSHEESQFTDEALAGIVDNKTPQLLAA